MSSSMVMWVEIVFNVGYLAIIWTLAIKMFKSMDKVSLPNIPVAHSLMLAFMLLALGDTGHVGFRVLAYRLGSLEAELHAFGARISLVGLGALATAITITFFYVIITDAWRKRYNAKYHAFEYILLIAAIARLILFIHPGNQWGSVVPPFGWSLARNIPLMLQGFGAAYLIIRDSLRHKDRVFRFIGLMILLSYICYLPVILFVQRVPMIGMLMMPKTLAYLAMAAAAYKGIFKQKNHKELKPIRMTKSIKTVTY